LASQGKIGSRPIFAYQSTIPTGAEQRKEALKDLPPAAFGAPVREAFVDEESSVVWSAS